VEVKFEFDLTHVLDHVVQAVFLRSAALALSRRAMEFPATAYSAATRTLPTTFAAWGALSQPALASLYGKMTDRMLVLVEGSQLAAAAPDLLFELIDGQKALPLHEVIFFYGRLL
jgi:hypothetical protein